MTLIKVEHLTKVFKNGDETTEVLKNLSFEIERGEFVSIMGPSGSGKSTLLHILGFLSDYTSGTYRFADKEFKTYTEDELARARNEEIGFVFQTFNLLGRNTVYENVRLPLLYSDVPEKEWDGRIIRAIEHVGLSHRKDFPALRLSGGEKQRASIARALVNNPRVIFADEPTGNLDSVNGKIVMDTLKKLNQEHGHTIILVTHEMSMAEYAERIIHIRDGRIDRDYRIEHSSGETHHTHNA